MRTILHNKDNLLSLETSNPTSLKISQNKSQNSWDAHLIVVRTLKQEKKLRTVASWRQNTSMPILQIKSFSLHHNDSFPKDCEMEVEGIRKTIDKIKQLDIGGCLYVLREGLIGFQTLGYKFGGFDLDNALIAVNNDGQCRVWPSIDVTAIEFIGTNPNKPSQILSFLLKILSQIIKNSQKSLFQGLVTSLSKNKQISYGQIYKGIQEFAKENEIGIASNLKRQKFHKSMKQIRHKSIRNTLMTSEPRKTSIQKRNIQIRYTSPPTSSQQSPIKRYTKPNVNWKYSNSSKNNVKQKTQEFRSPNFNWGVNHSNSIYFVSSLKGSQNKCVKSIEYERNGQNRDNIEIEEFLCDEQIIREKVSPTKYPCKNSLWTTQMTDSNKEECSMLCLEKLHIGKESSSIVMESLSSRKTQDLSKITAEAQRSPDASRTYNFGGLIPVPEIDSLTQRESQIEREVESLMGTRSIQINKSEVKDSFGNLEGFWEKKMVNFFEKDSVSMKESVYCGNEEQRYQQFPEIKLQMLGKLGRQIARSVIPEK